MLEIVKNFLIENNINNTTVQVGFSGGPDSVCLSLVLAELKEEFNLGIVLAYFNHGWRKEAKEEELFTIDFAKKYNLLYEIGIAPSDIKKTEEIARDYRYKFFEETAKKYNSKVVFLAHNKNDNIETLIYRIIKGTSIAGLCSIPKIRDIYYRPLLDVTKQEILEFLDEKKQDYRIDSSNLNQKYKRNLIRNKILPTFEEINPKYVDSINNLILNSIQAQKIIKCQIEKIKSEIFKDDKIFYEKYTKLDIELRLEILNDFIGGYLKYRNRKNLLMYDDFIMNNKHSKTSLNGDYYLRTRWKMIFIEKR